MINSKEVEVFNQLISHIPYSLKRHLFNLPNPIKQTAQEIRIRVNQPVCVISCAETQVLDCYASQTDITEFLQNICHHSIYSFQEQLKQGFITFKGGHRIGIAGSAVIENGEISNLKNITSFNIRIAKEFKGCAKEIYEKIKNDDLGTLILGAPSSGKTTILRDLARTFALNDRKVTVVDSRFEISGVHEGVPQMDISSCDVLAGFPKAIGILQALRCLSPEIIICDEIGNLKDAYAITQCLNSGVKIIASIHANNLKQFIKRPHSEALLSSGGFEKIVTLKDFRSPGKISEIKEVGEFFNDKDTRNFAFSNFGNFPWVYDSREKYEPY